MWCPILLLVAVVGCLGTPSNFRSNSTTENIVGGEIVSIEKIPYQLSLELNEVFNCGATIISEYRALTAAHCVIREANYRVRSGSSLRGEGGVLHQVTEKIIHEKYNNGDYDVAVLKLDKPFQKHEIINLAEIRPETGVNSTASGWGRENENGTASKKLRWVHIPIVDQQQCKDSYSYLTDRMICAWSPGKGACKGDSGGPLVVDKLLVGIASMGRPPCSEKDPVIFANVVALRDWIIKNAGLGNMMKK